MSAPPDTGSGLRATTDTLMTPGQVAVLFHVDPKTVTRWAHAGRLGSLRTPGGHRRFREAEVMQLLRSLTTEAGQTMTTAAGRS
ncbi:BldC family transcriptional regulator [Rhodococcus marinonascens]|uniref:BldC family transcriptional regulator n=1 Tax=Rhodococcus marinonascens TaxID=38311 RepID=UPI000933FF2A|nr:BldC family transcriptional regulator [Rhodococcus marinonascens]